jgi:asparagine synthase (glutamine-hydrolysing)
MLRRQISGERQQGKTMCGIAGFVLKEGWPEASLRSRVSAMNTAIRHRGPDGEGVWTEPEAGVAFAQRRLAIVDLTDTGAQPMVSHSGRLVMTYNGEIYNFRELRRDLERSGVVFRGTSDSEVLLEAWDRWGEDRTLTALNGMFAIAIWDRRERHLTLARDHFGIKPLLWFQTEEGLFFASELKALLKDASCPRAIDPASVNAVLRHGNVPAPWTILSGVSKVEPGTVLSWKPGREPTLRRFWTPLKSMIEGERSPSDLPVSQIVDEAESLIGDAVERQMIADVPLGAFLSGGIDSSLVVALMQKRSGRRVETFTIGFEEPGWDESPHAAAVAEHLGTRHHTLMTSGHAALELAPDIADIYDEPFADSSQLPTTLLCRMVRKHVTVALSGDGGDETFSGYERYGWGASLAAHQKRIPYFARSMLAAVGGVVPARLTSHVAGLAGKRGDHLGHKLQRALDLQATRQFADGYRQLLSLTTKPASLSQADQEHHPAAYGNADIGALHSVLSQMRTIDALSYLPDDILVKVDRASMSVGLEVRVPLLDHRVWGWAATIPDKKHRSGPKGKTILRAVLDRHVPMRLIDRPKSGFAVPLAWWLRRDLRDWAESLLPDNSNAFLDAAAVQRLWRAHLAGHHDHAPVLWSILMLESWRRSAFHA